MGGISSLRGDFDEVRRRGATARIPPKVQIGVQGMIGGIAADSAGRDEEVLTGADYCPAVYAVRGVGEHGDGNKHSG